MSNYVQPGEILTLAAPYDRDAGQAAKVGAFFGVAVNDVDSGDDGAFCVEGVFELTKTPSQAWTQGDKLYWDDSTKKLTTSGPAGMLVGVATANAGSADTTGFVRLNEACPSMLEGAEAAVADLAGTLTGTVDGTMVDVAASAAATAGGSTPTAGQVDTGIATAVATIVTGVNTQNKEVLTKLNALLAALRLNGIIAP